MSRLKEHLNEGVKIDPAIDEFTKATTNLVKTVRAKYKDNPKFADEMLVDLIRINLFEALRKEKFNATKKILK